VFFGAAGSFSIEGGPGGGTLARIEIPYRADRQQPATADRRLVAG
jgi:hypothetical protein